MDTHYNIHARACGCVDGRRKGKEWERNGREWERKRITAAAKNIRTFFKKTGIFLEKTIIFLLKTVIFLENGLILFRKDKNVRAGEERAFHIHIRRIPCTPGRFTKHLQQSFAKLLPLLPPSPLKPRWTGRFKGWWQWQHFCKTSGGGKGRKENPETTQKGKSSFSYILTVVQKHYQLQKNTCIQPEATKQTHYPSSHIYSAS